MQFKSNVQVLISRFRFIVTSTAVGKVISCAISCDIADLVSICSPKLAAN